ncbi:MAG: hypothetical protein HPM95_12390 [Alphaproteobacteria bacterium]|nr:hypothetical protein [Alphaproteobacteria bacterium]
MGCWPARPEPEAGSRSRFETIAARLQVNAERLQVSRLDVLTARHRLDLAGSIARADAGLAMRGTLSERRADAAEADTSPAKAMPVLVRGTLLAPRLLPDMTGLTGPPAR